MGSDSAELSVLITDDLEVRRLNRQYRKKNKATDVLSFSQREGIGGDIQAALLGDIVISFPTAVRQAAALGVSVREELFRLVIHGLLHLHGYDHEGVSPREVERMKRAERRLFRRIAHEGLV